MFLLMLAEAGGRAFVIEEAPGYCMSPNADSLLSPTRINACHCELGLKYLTRAVILNLVCDSGMWFTLPTRQLGS